MVVHILEKCRMGIAGHGGWATASASRDMEDGQRHRGTWKMGNGIGIAGHGQNERPAYLAGAGGLLVSNCSVSSIGRASDC